MDINILNNMEEKMLEGMTPEQVNFVQKLITQNQVLSSRLQQAQEMIAYKRLDYLIGITNIPGIGKVAPDFRERSLKEIEFILFDTSEGKDK